MSKSEIYLAEAVFRIINERKKQISEALLYDNVKNMEQYRQLMGERKALEYVDDELKSLLDRQEKDDE
jgi:predicted  nucleic acid-binding Zn-ribbon protein|tara:strand:- start:374 stop:577 length:204 start_codon:yes stop_codon:yes gene_type:complete